MENTQTLDRNLATLAEGALLIWWGIVIMVQPLTIGMGAIGTGLIMLGVTAARALKGVSTNGWTTTIGTVALVWGVLDTAFNPRFELSFALLLIVIGVVVLASLLARPKTA